MSSGRRTIDDFGAQFQRYRSGHNEGFYGGVEGLQDFFGPLLDVETLRGKRVAEIGAGPGRIVNVLLDAGVAHVTAVEPSEAFDVLACNTRARAGQVTYVKATGDQLPLGDYDAVFSVGVLHHIEDVDPVVARACWSLRPGGEFYAWLYGCEGNRLYLALLRPLRQMTKRMPDAFVTACAHVLTALLGGYIWLCRTTALPLPLRRHALGAMAKYTRHQRFLVLFDQLNPAYARYYSGAEAQALLERNGFSDVQLYHRHGHSWAVRGTRRR